MPEANPATRQGTVESLPAVATAVPIRRRRGYEAIKRLLDLVVSTAVMALLSPLFAAIALAIKLDSAGPIFFVQDVVGKDGNVFRMPKFRSMHPGSNNRAHEACLARNVLQSAAPMIDNSGRPIFKTALLNAKNITRVGRLLRKTSLDELPQLWCVVVGDMSLVGPRPSLPTEVALYQDWQLERLTVRPGLTGLYQVEARNCVPVEEMVRLDVQYVRKRSLALDLAILVRTPLAMFKGM